MSTITDTPPLVRIARSLSWNWLRASKYAEFVYAQRVTGFTVPDRPEFEPECTPLFLERLGAAGSYLEFGTGGSTILAAQRGLPFIAVESDEVFLAAVKRKIEAQGILDETTQSYIHANIGAVEAWGAPLWRRKTPARLARWRTYPHAPWAKLATLPEPYLILVDGRFRAACALLAGQFLKGRAGEILFDDYAERDHYRCVERHLDCRRRVGRMALFAPRADVDEAALAADIARACEDWR